jgi:hypothetical protein
LMSKSPEPRRSALAEVQRLSKRDSHVRLANLLAGADGKGQSQIAQMDWPRLRYFAEDSGLWRSASFALNLVADHFARSAQPFVPERLLVMGGGDAGEKVNPLQMCSASFYAVLAEKSGMGLTRTKGVKTWSG